MKLNLGCEKFKLAGFVNIDKDENMKPDIVADALYLPYEDNSIDEIYAGHLLEHFSHTENVLKEWRRVLKEGGRITITVPDIEKALNMYKEERLTLTWLNDVVFGDTNRALQNHHQVFTKDILLDYMKIFKEMSLLEDSPYLLARVEWQTIITAIK